MTDTEAKNLADRIIALDLPKEQQAIETAREFQRIAAQCGWQIEEIARLQILVMEAHNIIYYKLEEPERSEWFKKMRTR